MDTASRMTDAATDDLLERYLGADFPWYGLDEAWTGPRSLMPLGTSADGAVDYGSIVHGEPPGPPRQPQPPLPHETDEQPRFAVVVTVAERPGRRLDDGTGVLEPTSVSSAAWLAGCGLLAVTWPAGLDRALRQDWLDQQTALAWDLADDLEGEPWSPLTLPVNGTPQPFRYRESEYGWVLAGAAPGVHLGAYGRGISAYGLGFAALPDLATLMSTPAPAQAPTS